VDFIEAWMEYTSAAYSPKLFRLWSGISMLAGAMERRVWVRTGPRVAFPNLYVLFVAPPGVGKLIIEDVKEMWSDAVDPVTQHKAFFVASDSVTKASLIDELATCRRQFLPPEGDMLEYQSLLVAAEEFAVLMPGYDMEFIGTLNSLYNNKAKHSEKRRTSIVKEVQLIKPQLNLLAGAQPGWLASVFPEEAWSTGLASRMTMIYSSETEIRDPFAMPKNQDRMKEWLFTRLGQISQCCGEAMWEPEAMEGYRHWIMNGMVPVPQHSKLEHYSRRRNLHLLKLAVVAAQAENSTPHAAPVISFRALERAMGWLLESERVMPDIFRAMVGKSDFQVLEELHYFVLQTWTALKGRAVSERLLHGFLAARVPADKILRLVDVATSSNMIVRVAGTDTYLPRAKPGISGVE